MANRNKTGTPFKIPLLPKSEELIIKYKNHIRTKHTGKLLPSLSNQRLNSYLKEIADPWVLKRTSHFIWLGIPLQLP